ncbi:arginine--tRNA ligase [Snodgrassella sp. ESL0253]|uniref:arginine--tRNA ligase n=1 Tax=Snodgrassella sp. ESL0253 TaxID=2705031 RepID=UPI0015839D47|nr:arginine--tRNA ligase [Snodgrassella sp. ESL0253]NUE65812.1 arginine--tRNA ligase [Snodgrassella sp. ESL0253]
MELQKFLSHYVDKAFEISGLSLYPALLRPASKAEFGHYQINGAMGAAKSLKLNPREVAENVVNNLASLKEEGIVDSIEILGSGFINIFLSSGFLSQRAFETLFDERLGVKKQPKQIIPIDYPSANLAKEMHVGHLRASIIGDALNRVLRFLGHDAFSQDHVGDWGTQFGMLITYMVEAEKVGQSDVALADLEEFYRNAKKRFEESEEFAKTARSYVVQLQSGDEKVLALWRRFVQVSQKHCLGVYKKLGLLVNESNLKGESSYNDDLQPTVDELVQKGIAVDSEGAKVVFLDEFKDNDGNPTAFIIQKRDGGFLYSTTDLACIRYRVRQLKADRIIYVVDVRQSLHFKELFATVHKAGFATEKTKLEHIAFGTMMGKDGKPFKTRDGNTVKLIDLLNEAVERAAVLVRQKNPALSDAEIDKISTAVGISSIKYADLSKNRTSDYIFNWEGMLSFDGNTAPYLQYAYTRIQSLLNKSGQSIEPDVDHVIRAIEQDEINLLCLLLQFEDVIISVAKECMPHYLANYLFQLASSFSKFYEKYPILKEKDEIRNSRLQIARLTGKTLKQGMHLLGLDVLDKM